MAAIFKNMSPTSPFEMIPRATLQDQDLSIEALGALLRINALPMDWEINITHLENLLKVGKEKRLRIFEELKAAGYMLQIQRQLTDEEASVIEKTNRAGKKYRHGQWVWIYGFSCVKGEFNTGGKPAYVKPAAGKPGCIYNTEGEETDKKTSFTYLKSKSSDHQRASANDDLCDPLKTEKSKKFKPSAGTEVAKFRHRPGTDKFFEMAMDFTVPASPSEWAELLNTEFGVNVDATAVRWAPILSSWIEANTTKGAVSFFIQSAVIHSKVSKFSDLVRYLDSCIRNQRAAATASGVC